MFESRRRYRGRLPADVTTSRLRTLPAVTLPAGPRFWSVRVPSTGFGTRFGAVAGVEPAAQAPNASARPCSYRPAPVARERPPLRLCPKRRPPPRPVADRGRHDDFGCGPSGAAAPLSPRPPSRSCVTFRFLFRFFFLVLRAVAVELRGGGSSLFGRTVVLSGGTFVINSRKAW